MPSQAVTREIFAAAVAASFRPIRGRATVPAARRPDALTVRDFVVPAPVRFAQAVAEAAIVRDVAAFAALVVLATMLSVLSGIDAVV
ncbi:MAG TPA: hypothetical protein VMP03_02090 [Methylomirabilota bacterium]|nr:hypothetical protein [Methylomirabilota bacterium]